MRRVLLISDMAATGFGRVGRELGTGLLARGWDVRIIGINWRGVDGEINAAIGAGTIDQQAERVAERMAELRADPLTDRIMPAQRGGDGMGYALTGPAIRGRLWPGWTPDGVIVVADPRAMWDRAVRDDGAMAEARRRGRPVLNYVPIEGTGLPRDWAEMWRVADPVAMSDFGAGELERLLGRPVAIAYHGVSEAFHPVSPATPGSWRGRTVTSKAGAKEAVGLGGKKVILRVDRFVFRKNYPAWFRVLAPVMERHPDLVAVAHTVPLDDTGQGNIWQLISRVPGAVQAGMDQSGNAVWEHPRFMVTGWHDSWRGLSDADLNVLVNAADLVVSPTMAEGFGLCLAEAEACGVPVVATDCSAVSEVVGPGGVLIEPTGHITSAYAHEWALVNEPAMTRAVERLISKPALRRDLGAAGRRHVARFTWSRACDVFDDLLSASRQPATIGA